MIDNNVSADNMLNKVFLIVFCEPSLPEFFHAFVLESGKARRAKAFGEETLSCLPLISYLFF